MVILIDPPELICRSVPALKVADDLAVAASVLMEFIEILNNDGVESKDGALKFWSLAIKILFWAVSEILPPESMMLFFMVRVAISGMVLFVMMVRLSFDLICATAVVVL